MINKAGNILSFLLILVLVSGCKPERVKPSVDPSLQVKTLPAQESWNSRVAFTDSGKTKAVLYTGHLRVYIDTRETLLDSNLKVDFYDEDEIKTTTLTAKYGRVDDATQNLYARDSVVVVSDSGVVIKTDELMWRNKDRKITSDKYVTILSPKEKIEGYGFESDQSLRNYVIHRITYTTRRDTLE